eukprot:756250-Hanusia_phi.AAC.1
MPEEGGGVVHGYAEVVAGGRHSGCESSGYGPLCVTTGGRMRNESISGQLRRDSPCGLNNVCNYVCESGTRLLFKRADFA